MLKPDHSLSQPITTDLPPARSQLWPRQPNTINYLQPEGRLSIFQTKCLHLCCFGGHLPGFRCRHHPWASTQSSRDTRNPMQPAKHQPSLKKHSASQTYPPPRSFRPEPILQTALPERRVSPWVRNYHWSHVLNDKAFNALSLGLHANEENK